jgi:hypothetical protein
MGVGHSIGSGGVHRLGACLKDLLNELLFQFINSSSGSDVGNTDIGTSS